ncbi:MAG: AmmeMemoRadiSam system protein B [Bryobacteraceae bacterium]
MAKTLPRLRRTLEFLPAPDHRGLIVRDPYHYSDAMIVVPPLLARCLQCFDGDQTDLDLRAELARLTGELEVGEIEEHLISTLSSSGFLEDGAFRDMRDRRRREFAEAPLRAAAHAGSAYPGDPVELRETMERWMDGARRPIAGLRAIAAPHVSPDGGWPCYGAAFGALGPELVDRTFVILATSHFGESERFGLSRKPFATPLGEAQTDAALVDELAEAGGEAVEMEDYCHSFEHTVEFQVLFLQHVLGPRVRIVPVLCGPFGRSLYGGGVPEDDPGVANFLAGLRRAGEREGDRLVWVLGIDLAHMGARYGDDHQCIANEGLMREVEQRDLARLDRVLAGDAEGFWSLVRDTEDDLKWCGSAPLYSFLRAAPGLRGQCLRYGQWNIDPASVVSFAALAWT